LTYCCSQKQLTSSIERGGGRVGDLAAAVSADEALANGSASGSGARSSRPSLRASLSGGAPASADATQVHVVADKPRTTCKYLFALARGES
jgi:hypothetical protein